MTPKCVGGVYNPCGKALAGWGCMLLGPNNNFLFKPTRSIQNTDELTGILRIERLGDRSIDLCVIFKRTVVANSLALVSFAKYGSVNASLYVGAFLFELRLWNKERFRFEFRLNRRVYLRGVKPLRMAHRRKTRVSLPVVVVALD